MQAYCQYSLEHRYVLFLGIPSTFLASSFLGTSGLPLQSSNRIISHTTNSTYNEFGTGFCQHVFHSHYAHSDFITVTISGNVSYRIGNIYSVHPKKARKPPAPPGANCELPEENPGNRQPTPGPIASYPTTKDYHSRT